MKKYFIVLAAAVIALAGCKKTPEETGSKYTSIKIKEAELTLGIEESAKLHILWEPAEIAEAPVCEWASANPAVATVDQNGTVIGVAQGETNITAKFGELQAACKVTVQDEMDLFAWGGMHLWDYDDEHPLSEELFDVELSIGVVKCMLVPGMYRIWDSNFSAKLSEGRFAGIEGGPGYLMDAENVPTFVIAEGDYKGAYISYGGVWVVDPEKFNPSDTAYIACAAAGKLGDAKKFYEYLTDTTSSYTWADGITGLEIWYCDFDESEYFIAGLAGTGVYAGDENGVHYRSNVSWFTAYYCLQIDEETEEVSWAPVIDKYYEFLQEESAPKRSIVPFRETPGQKVIKNKRVFVKK